jgi:hypothetical protein
MLALHSWLGVRIPCRAFDSSSKIHSAVFERGDECFVVLTNTDATPRDVLLSLNVDRPLRFGRDLRSGAEASVVAGVITLHVPARSGTVVQLFR